MIRIERNTRDKMQAAMDGLLGVTESRHSGIRPFRGIREAYIYCTGDVDCLQVDRGGLYRTSEAIATTDFPNILLNSLTKKLVQDYEEFQIIPGLEKLYTTTIAGDYKPQDRVRLGYLQDLPTVARPDRSAYRRHCRIDRWTPSQQHKKSAARNRGQYQETGGVDRGWLQSLPD